MEQMRSEQQPPRRGKMPESQMTAGNNQQPQPPPPPPPPPPKKCPRCDSANTKFCYYNNYSLSQPRYFCKSCRRYWTQGGTLRNVPVGGGCRKSKRSKPPSAASTSSSAEIQSNQCLPSPAIQTHNLTGMIPDQSLRSLPQPVIPSIGSFYPSGSFLSSLAAMQSFIQQPPMGINPGPAAGPNLASTSQFGGGPTGNRALLQGLNLPSLKAQTPQQFQAQNEIYRSQQILVPPTPVISSWAQTVINNRAGNSSGPNPSFWGGATGENIGGGDQMGSSLNPNQWSDNHPGYNPSQ